MILPNSPAIVAVYGRDDAVIDITCGTVQGNAITFVDILFLPV